MTDRPYVAMTDADLQLLYDNVHERLSALHTQLAQIGIEQAHRRVALRRYVPPDAEQKDYEEFIDDMSLGGTTYNPDAGAGQHLHSRKGRL